MSPEASEGEAQATTSRHSNDICMSTTEETFAALSFSSVNYKLVALATYSLEFLVVDDGRRN